MRIVFHITKRSDWLAAAAQGSYEGDTLGSEGFIHCSTAEQVVPVANARFRGRSGLVLLAIDESRVRAEVRYENLEGGTSLFPHVYGPLEAVAVVDVLDFEPGPDGKFQLPRLTDGS